MGSKFIYWIVHEEKCMWSTACPYGLSPLFTHSTIILNFSINELLVETETSLSGFTALTTSNISFGKKKKKGRALISVKVIILYSFKHDMQPRNESWNRLLVHVTHSCHLLLLIKVY